MFCIPHLVSCKIKEDEMGGERMGWSVYTILAGKPEEERCWEDIHTYMPIRFTDPEPVNTAEYETCQ
jgi:hypothetical protein